MHRLYLYYCYQLGILPKKQQPCINRPELEAIWRNIDKVLAEHAFVKEHQFPSLQAIEDYRKACPSRWKPLPRSGPKSLNRCAGKMLHRNWQTAVQCLPVRLLNSARG